MTAAGFLAVGTGAALGAWLRWILGVLFNPVFPTVPLGTLAANLVGGYLIGVCVEWLGLHEAVGLLARGQSGWALAHVGAHLAGSLVFTFLGIQTVRALAAG